MSMDELSAEEIALFLNESAEMVDTIEELLVDLEKGGDPEAIAAIFRAAHTLKGGSATAGMTNMARLTHALESLLDLVRSGQRAVDADIVDALLEAIDVLRRCLAAVERDGNDRAVDVGPLAHRLESLARGWGAAAAAGPAGARAPVAPPGAADEPRQPAAGVSTPLAPHEAGGSPPAAAPAGGGEWERWAAQAAGTGERLYRFVISVDPEAPMPVVRLYQALLVLQERGRVLHTDPPQREIEEGLADHARMAAVLATADDPAHIKEVLGEVSHLQSVEWEPLGNEGAAATAPAAAAVRAAGAASAAVASPVAASPVAPATSAAGAPRRAGAAAAAPEAATEEAAGGTGAGGPQGPAGASPAGASGPMADTIRVSVRVLDKLMNLVGELVIDRTRIARLGHVDLSINDLREELELVTGHLSRITTDLQDTIMQARMVPVETLFRKFPRMVRDLARRLNKQVRFVMSGEDTELDRAVIEQIGDPLVHLIRNAIDHGVEPPADRRAAGKDPEGLVQLKAYHQENSIYIEVSDDGRGIDPNKVKQAAVAKGLITPEQAQKLDTSEAYDLLFLPGFTTTDKVSDVSGRGVGLDVVRKNIERINGTVTLESQVGRGTRWIIRLPLTLAIVQAMLVRVRDTTFAIPLQSVVEILRVADAQVRMANGWRMIHVRDQVIPLVNPGDVWGPTFAATWRTDQANPVVVLQAAAAPLALAVDRVIGEQEIVIKNIEGMVGHVAGVSGASILGDGSVALILDVTGFTKEVRRLGALMRRDDRRYERSA